MSDANQAAKIESIWWLGDAVAVWHSFDVVQEPTLQQCGRNQALFELAGSCLGECQRGAHIRAAEYGYSSDAEEIAERVVRTPRGP